MTQHRKLSELQFQRGAIVVSAGGHLEQAIRRANQFNLDDKVTFYTPENSQTASKLIGKKHVTMTNVKSRDLIGLFKAIFELNKSLSKNDYDYVLSTGAGVALACLVVCKFKRIDFVYIESIARQNNPSFTGRILELFNHPELFTESANFNDRKWKRIDSLFSSFQKHENSKVLSNDLPLKIFVTVGTVHKYAFQRIVKLVNSVRHEGDYIVWQIGDVSHKESSGEVHREMSESALKNFLISSDVVISHAGVGSILNILDFGKFPILIPRLSRFGEHIDDHQLQIAALVSKLDLGLVINEGIERSNLVNAAKLQVKRK